MQAEHTGTFISRGRRIKGDTQADLAKKLFVSRPTIAHHENGRVPVPKSMRALYADEINDAELTMHLWGVDTNGASIPFYNGSHVDSHQLSMLSLIKKEWDEFEASQDGLPLHKPVSAMTNEEKQAYKKMAKESLDVAGAILTKVAHSVEIHGTPFNTMLKEWRTELVANKLIKRDSV